MVLDVVQPEHQVSGDIFVELLCKGWIHEVANVLELGKHHAKHIQRDARLLHQFSYHLKAAQIAKHVNETAIETIIQGFVLATRGAGDQIRLFEFRKELLCALTDAQKFGNYLAHLLAAHGDGGLLVDAEEARRLHCFLVCRHILRNQLNPPQHQFECQFAEIHN